MSNKAIQLRRFLSKNKISRPESKNIDFEPDQAEPSKIDEQTQNEQSDNENEESPISSPQHLPEPEPQVDSQLDPLKYLDDHSSNVDEPLNIMDLIKGSQDAEQDQKEKSDTYKAATSVFTSLLSKIEQKDETPKQQEQHLLGSLAKKRDESTLVNQIMDDALDEDEKDPEEVETLPPLDNNKKEKVMCRMATARQGLNKLNKITFGMGLLRRTSEAILNKAKYFEKEMGVDDIKEIKEVLNKEFILNDSDVQQITEEKESNVNVGKARDIDVSEFMGKKEKDKNKEGKKKNTLDLFIGKNKKKGKIGESKKSG